MQRVRIGLTGLAFVFLAVLMAAIFTGQSRTEAPITPNGVVQGPGVASQPAQEPLATLGLTPSNSDSNTVTPPPAPAAPATRR